MLIVRSSQLKNSFSNTHVSVPEHISRKVQKWSEVHIPDTKVYSDPDDPSFGRERDSHVTVKFGLHTNNPDDVTKIVSDFGDLMITLGKISKFSSDQYDVIKIDVQSEDLCKLNSLISDKLKCTDTHPTYQPHLTISYVQKNSCDDLLGCSDFSGLQWTTSEIEFSSQDNNLTKIAL